MSPQVLITVVLAVTYGVAIVGLLLAWAMRVDQ